MKSNPSGIYDLLFLSVALDSTLVDECNWLVLGVTRKTTCCAPRHRCLSCYPRSRLPHLRYTVVTILSLVCAADMEYGVCR